MENDVLEPIVILGMPRSGTSMTSGIFAYHGCWVGRCRKPDKLNPKGYFENLDIKEILIRRFGRLAQSGKIAQPQEGFQKEVLNLNPTGNWIAKHSAMYWRAWHEFKPKYVCVRRNKHSITQSNLDTRFFGTQNVKRIHELIDEHNRQMDRSGGVNIYTDELIKGNYNSLKHAFEHCGLDFDPSIAKSFINPEYWRH